MDAPFRPYAYQERLLSLYQTGANVILQAPTGAGKTIAALLPGIDGLDLVALENIHRADSSQKIVYGVPLRVLANSFQAEFTRLAQTKHWQVHWHPTIQTGEHPEDALFEGHVIFATVDQMLASFLNIPYGLPKKLDNINAGAFIGSYLIFDEFHLYPHNEMMLTVLAMLKMLAGISRFVLMSATFSPVFLGQIAKMLDAEMIADLPGTPIADGLFHDVSSVRTQQRTWFADDGQLDAEAVLKHKGQRTLCICNTVDRAQALYLALRKRNVACHLLHSRFFRQDRTAIEQMAREKLKKGSKANFILIATQVVEVGLDISTDVLLTECAPAASLIQRAGRCARYAGEVGRVHVFQPLETNDNGELEVNYAPYLDEGKEDICQKTWLSLISSDFNGQVMGYPQEQQLIAAAHGEADQQFVEGLEISIDQRIDDITHCMSGREVGNAGQLIRQNSNVPLYLHHDPNTDDILTSRPWQREAISLSRGHIKRCYEDMQSADAPFLLCGGEEDRDNDPDSSYAQAVFQWTPVREAKEVFSYWRFVAHPAAVTYTPELGLQLRPDEAGNEPPSSPEVKRPDWDRPRYYAERYHEHIAGLYLAYTMPLPMGNRYRIPLHDEILYPLRRLCEKLGHDPAGAERYLRLTLALHDVGKLNTPWQQWSRKWRSLYLAKGYLSDLPADDRAPLGHTDFDSNSAEQRELQKQVKGRRGPHAGESAAACLELLWNATHARPEDRFWFEVVVSTIMHHHTPEVTGNDDFQMVADVQETLIESLRQSGFEQEAETWAGMIARRVGSGAKPLAECVAAVKPDKQQHSKALMYFLFVRVLRLADQRSGFYWQKYGRERMCD